MVRFGTSTAVESMEFDNGTPLGTLWKCVVRSCPHSSVRFGPGACVDKHGPVVLESKR